jgi:hypothetical protein
MPMRNRTRIVAVSPGVNDADVRGCTKTANTRWASQCAVQCAAQSSDPTARGGVGATAQNIEQQRATSCCRPWPWGGRLLAMGERALRRAAARPWEKKAGDGWRPGQRSAIRRGARLPALNREQGKKGALRRGASQRWKKGAEHRGYGRPGCWPSREEQGRVLWEKPELTGGRRPWKSQGSYGRWSSRPGGRWDRGSAARMQGTRPWGAEQGAPALRELGGHGRPLRAGVLLP